jgi:hypothetical protein
MTERGAAGSNQRLKAGAHQRAAVRSNQEPMRPNIQRDPAELAERASKIGKVMHLDPETMLKIADAEKEN